MTKQPQEKVNSLLTPEEKAKELIEKFGPKAAIVLAKGIANNSFGTLDCGATDNQYWQSVLNTLTVK